MHSTTGALALLLAAGGALSQSVSTQYTATGTADVAAARATAKTSSPTSNVKGKVFDRLAIIWLENTDYDLAAGDPNLDWLAKKGIKLTNHFAVTHPSEPNYVAVCPSSLISHASNHTDKSQAIGGDYFGMNNDNFNFIDKNVSTVLDLLDTKGISWGEYQEDQPYSGFEGMGYVNQQTVRLTPYQPSPDLPRH